MQTRIWRRVLVTSAATIAASAALSGVATADVPFDFVPGGLTFSQSGPGNGVNGGHPDVTIGFKLQTDPTTATNRPPQAPKSVGVTLPEGLVGDPTSVGATCPIDYVIQAEKAVGLGKCAREAAAGVVRIDAAYPVQGLILVQERRLWRVPAGPNEVVAFGTSIISVPIRIGVTVSPSGGYRVQATGAELPQAAFVRDFKVTLWGVPADRQGVGTECDGAISGANKICLSASDPNAKFGGPLPGATRKPFMANPSVCDASLDATIRVVPYGTIFSPVEASVNGGTVSGCEDQPFGASLDVTPASKAAGKPSGYTVGIDVPQNDDPDGVSTAHVKDVSVTLPEGVAISAPSANGLDACSDAQFDLNGDDLAACPDRSSIGSMMVESPVLEEPLHGKVYLGTQLSKDPMSGDMYRLFLQVQGPGVLVKLKGSAKADPVTGQLTTTFENNPQVPFGRIELTLDDGQRASLANPQACGTHTAKATLTSWAGHTVTADAPFVIDEGCPTGQFAPSMTAGTANPLAGAFSPFSMTVNRTDADQDLSRLNLELPSGLLAALGSVPLCGDADAAAGTCAEASRIGSTSVLVGSGSEPLPLDGKVYVTGPYKGAPFGLSVVVPAKVGPFDLGDVVVRGQLQVDANNARATAVTDPFPTIVGGVPVRLRQVNVSMDRPGFTFNPTSCQQQSVNGGFWSTNGVAATASVPYQAQGCDQLRLQPRLGLQWVGKTQMAQWKHPGLKAQLGDMLGQANLKKVKVTLPLSAALDPKNAKALCEPAQAAARNCPADSIVGQASASTPALHERVSGPVYFVRGVRVTETGREVGTLPKLWVPLSGQGVTVDLWADSFVDSKKRLETTFTNVPDVPVRDFQMEINGGANGILKATQNVCAASKTTTIEYTGHNGGVTQQRVAFTAPDCRPQIVDATNSRNKTVGVRAAGIGPGTLTITGSGLNRATRKVVRSDNALIRATLTRNGQSHLRSGKTLRTRLTVRFQPATGKAINIRKTVRIAPVKVKR